MLNRPLRETIWVSWLYVVSCAAAIFATVPFGRRITEYIDLFVDDSVFTIIVVGVFAVLAFYVVRFLIRRNNSSAGYYFWLGVVAVVFCVYAYNLRDNAVETLHFLQYGLLGLLIYRALCHRVRDSSIYCVTE
ncbi:MAG: hypothetical protein ACPGPC_15460 [Alphaproteobacteria bacterium]